MADTHPEHVHHSLKHVYSLNHIWFHNLPKESHEIKKGMRPFITISRQGGAGGHTLAEAILKEMGKRQSQTLFQGWHIFDNELCQMLEQDDQLKVTMNSLLTEEYRSAVDDLIHELIDGASPQYAVVKKMSKCVRTLAMMGKAIIVGRGGTCLTQGLPLGVRVRLVAPLAVRIRHTMTLLGIGETDAKKVVEDWDRNRAKLVKVHFNKNIDDPLLYDVVWNTDQVPMDVIAASVVEMVDHKVTYGRSRNWLR